MHGGMSRQSLQTFTHVDQIFDRIIRLIRLAQIRAGFERLVKRHAEITRNHFCNRITLCIRHIERAPHVADDTLCRQRTEGNNLYDAVFSVFPHDIVDHLLTTFETEIDVDIGHGNSLRVQETLENQLIADRVDVRDLQTVRDDTARRRTTSRTDHDTV